MSGDIYTGRDVIYTSESEINETNLIDVLKVAVPVFEKNRRHIDYLYNYVKGKQPILGRTKHIRADINNKVVTNYAHEIIKFKTGYLLGDPVQYVNRNADEVNVDEINRLNDYLMLESKDAEDEALAEWFSISGVGYRMALPNRDFERGVNTPFKVYTLDPRETFIVRHSDFSKRVVMAVMVVPYKEQQQDGTFRLEPMYCVYTDKQYFEVKGDTVVKTADNDLGMIPIVEYSANTVLMGEFEVVLSLLDALNLIKSNRVDGVEQFVQSLIKFINVDIEEETFKALMEMGAIKLLGSDGSTTQNVEFMTQELNQSQVQILEDSIKSDIEIICGIPNRKGGASTSDTGAAVIMRDGWSDAESRAKSTELIFKRSERLFINIILNIMNTLDQTNINAKDIDIRFTRRNYENIQAKSQVLDTMLSNDKVHPRLAFVHSGLFTDPDLAYLESKNYYEAVRERNLQLIEKEELETKPPILGNDPGE